jgi:hypothetical protein
MSSTACTYIGNNAYQEKFGSLDEDGDGAPKEGPNADCSDNNPNRTPGAEEIPYDGWDNDCDDADLLDVDGDGFPGVSREWYEANNTDPDAQPWPANMPDSPDKVDCVDDPAVHPEAKSIFPGSTSEEPYDGIDHDCRADNDFDIDEDGFVARGYEEAFTTYVAEWGYDSLTAEFDDCNDFDPAVYPMAPGDEWYDGDDTNCDDKNDFDQDGDGFMPGSGDDEDNDMVEDFAEFLETYHGGVNIWEDEWNDCLDEESPSIFDPAAFGSAVANPALVYPGAPDEAYDGLDSDCAGDNDFDQDGDGFMPDFALNAPLGTGTGGPDFDYYTDAWGYAFEEHEEGARLNDCVDDPSFSGLASAAQINPGALETLDDTLDQDCDGNDSTSPFSFGETSWDTPRAPRIEFNGDNYVIVSSGDQVELNTGAFLKTVGLSLFFPADAGNAEPILASTPWYGFGFDEVIGDAVDSSLYGGEFYVSLSYQRDQNFTGGAADYWSFITTRPMSFSDYDQVIEQGNSVFGGEGTDYGRSDLDLVMDADGVPWNVSCGNVICDGTTTGCVENGVLHVVQGTTTSPRPAGLVKASFPAEVCFWDDVPEGGVATAHLCGSSGCESYDFYAANEALIRSATQPYGLVSGIESADYRHGWHVLGRGSAGATLVGPVSTYSDLITEPIRAVDVSEANGQLYIGAVLEDGTVRVWWGDPDATMDSVDIPYGLDAQGLSIHAGADRLVVAVSGEGPLDDQLDDGLGWVFMGL